MVRRSAVAVMFALALGLTADLSLAQGTQFRTVARTGLFTLYPGHSARLHIVQLAGSPVQPTDVTLRLLDDRGRQVGQFHGTLQPDGALRLTVRSPQGGSDKGGTPVRGEATLLTSANNFGTMPILTLELVNDRTLDVQPATTCPIPYDPRGQSGPVGDCGCELVNDFTT